MSDQPRACSLTFNADGFAYCPECGAYLGFLDEHLGRMMLYTGGLWIDWGPRMWCPKCPTMFAFRAAEMPMMELLAKIERRINNHE